MAEFIASGRAIDVVLGFVLLQVDTWTRGYYTKRLLVGVPVVIIALSFLLFA